MCDSIADPVSMDDAALNLVITEYARTEAMTAGRRLSAIAELAHRRLGSELARSREKWVSDAWASCAAEISADLTISDRKASGLMHQGLALRDGLPMIGALLARGDITLAVATTATWRTRFVEDPDLLARIDADIAAVATRFGKYSEQKLVDAIDSRIGRHDPDAVIRFRAVQRTLDVRFGKRDDETGTVSVHGRVSITDGELSDRRMEAMARSVCRDDPRPLGTRRSEAYGIIAAGGDHLPCRCDKPDCPAKCPDARGKHLNIVILTDDPNAGTGVGENGGPATDPDNGPRYDPDYDWERHWTDTDPDAEEPDDEPVDGGCESAEPAADFTPAAPAPCPYTTIIAGGGIVPAPLLADLRRMGASVRSVVNPEDLTAEPGYRPSAAQVRFVRCRDMTCRFPGCDHPAEYGDLDHTVAHGRDGLTHPGNIKTLCRKHHLLKTFWVGRGGWSDEQLDDGTIVWTSPSGLEHRAPPGSRIYFPNWDTTTPLPETPVAATEQASGRELRMPLRKRTRALQHAANIRAEREHNRRITEENPAPF